MSSFGGFAGIKTIAPRADQISTPRLDQRLRHGEPVLRLEELHQGALHLTIPNLRLVAPSWQLLSVVGGALIRSSSPKLTARRIQPLAAISLGQVDARVRLRPLSFCGLEDMSVCDQCKQVWTQAHPCVQAGRQSYVDCGKAKQVFTAHDAASAVHFPRRGQTN
jgi:hypothetical protein